jgi:hypothetical protein
MFYENGNTIFHAHGAKGTLTGFTDDLKWWFNTFHNKNFPKVFRQLINL